MMKVITAQAVIQASLQTTLTALCQNQIGIQVLIQAIPPAARALPEITHPPRTLRDPRRAPSTPVMLLLQENLEIIHHPPPLPLTQEKMESLPLKATPQIIQAPLLITLQNLLQITVILISLVMNQEITPAKTRSLG